MLFGWVELPASAFPAISSRVVSNSVCMVAVVVDGLGPVRYVSQRGAAQSSHAREDDAVGGSDVPATANPRLSSAVKADSLSTLALPVLQRRGLAKARDNDVHQAVGAAGKVLEHVALAAPPLLLAHAHAQLATSGQLQAIEHVDGGAAVQQDVPVGAEAAPVRVQDAGELVAAVLPEQLLERPAMVQCEDRVRADELLDEERRRADLAARVLDGRASRVLCGACGGQLGQVDGGEDPPAGLQLVQDDARLVRFDRVDVLAAGEGPGDISRAHGTVPLLPCSPVVRTARTRPCPAPARPASASRSPPPSGPCPPACSHCPASRASSRLSRSRRQSACGTSRPSRPAPGCRWRGS